MTRPMIVWDVDDVMNSLTFLWFQRTVAPKAVLQYSGLHCNPPNEQLGISKEEYLDSLDFCRENFLYSIPPRKEVTDFFESCGEKFTHVVLSSVPAGFMGRSAEWVLDYFGKWIQSVCFVPSYRKDYDVRSTLFSTKKDAVQFFGGTLVDDSPQNVNSVIENGGKAFLFPAPWNHASNVSFTEALQKLSEDLLK